MKKEEKKQPLMLCPRCELNYITKKDKLCPVCKAEKGLVDKTILLPDEDEIERLCPICKVNYLSEDEDICFVCAKEKVKEPDEPEEKWANDEDDEKALPPEEIEISLELTAEEEEAEEEEEEDFGEQYKEPDDFDYDVDPNDFEDDEEDEDEEDEDDDDEPFVRKS